MNINTVVRQSTVKTTPPAAAHAILWSVLKHAVLSCSFHSAPLRTIPSSWLLCLYHALFAWETQTKKQWLKWFCEAGGLTCQSQVGANPIVHTHSNPTNLALFRRKIALYRFNQGGGGLILLQGRLKWEQGGWAPRASPHFNHCKKDRQTDRSNSSRCTININCSLSQQNLQKNMIGIACKIQDKSRYR